MRLYLLIISTFFVSGVWAEAPKSYQPGSGMTTANPVTVVLGLLLIIGLILVLAWAVKHFNNSPFAVNQTIKTVATMSVGTRERVVLVEVGDKQILLGVATGRVNTLHVFDEKVVDSAHSSTSDFSNKLKQFLHAEGDKSSEEKLS